MNFVPRATHRLRNNESGATAVEYGLMMALMTLALLGALAATGDGTSDKWNDVATDISAAMNSAGE